MREGFDAPTLELPPEDVSDLRAFFDGQSRVQLALWVRHEQQGVDGPVHDHHLVLGVEDSDYAAGDMWALELGMPLPPLRFGEPQWIPDIFPLSEVEALRSFATVVWEGAPTGGDPLDFRLTWEPLAAAQGARERFVELVGRDAGIRRVEATRRRLWKGDEEVEVSDELFVDADDIRHAVSIVNAAARTADLVSSSRWGTTLGRPSDPRVVTATLYGDPA